MLSSKRLELGFPGGALHSCSRDRRSDTVGTAPGDKAGKHTSQHTKPVWVLGPRSVRTGSVNRAVAGRNTRSAVAGSVLVASFGLLASAGNVHALGPSCDPDFNGDMIVNVADLAQILGSWGPCPGCPTDLNGDDVVDAFDLAILMDCFGNCPCPVCGPQPVGGAFDRTLTVDATNVEAAGLGLIVTHLYATGDNVSVGDRLLTTASASIDAVRTTYFQHPIGTQTAPPSVFVDIFPDLAYDTFVTMNKLLDDPLTVVNPNFIMDKSMITGGWFVAANDPQREAEDISAVTGNPGDAGVLIAQITLQRPPIVLDLPEYSGTITLLTSVCNGGNYEGVEADVRFSPADLDGDGTIGIVDFLKMLSVWGACDAPCPPACQGDIDQDCEVGIIDFLLLLAHWDV